MQFNVPQSTKCNYFKAFQRIMLENKKHIEIKNKKHTSQRYRKKPKKMYFNKMIQGRKILNKKKLQI